MRAVRDPRCPKHPDYELDIAWPAGLFAQMPPIWACSVCRRLLGFASCSKDTLGPRLPRRRLTQDRLEEEAYYRP
jgi:hypothetical protein